MKHFTYTIQDANGIHARPAGLLVKEAQKFTSEISLTSGEKTGNLKKLFAIMGMGIKQGNEVTVTVEGEDEVAAAAAIEEFISANL